MKCLEKLFKKIHVCNFSTPIISRYILFNYRDIVYECKCGKREIIRTHTPYGKPFPIQTTNFITHTELLKIANN
jgi:hypothetical protein